MRYLETKICLSLKHNHMSFRGSIPLLRVGGAAAKVLQASMPGREAAARVDASNSMEKSPPAAKPRNRSTPVALMFRLLSRAQARVSVIPELSNVGFVSTSLFLARCIR